MALQHVQSAPAGPDRDNAGCVDQSQAREMHVAALRWYGRHARDLPWRRPGCSPWGVLVSEVMLQQTPVARVLSVWTGWQQRWPGPADLAACSPADAVRAWGRLGYPRRALRLHATATVVVERHHGHLPEDLDALRALPGVGSYTAAAVATFAFGRRHAVLDTNVRRVLARILDAVALPPRSLTVAETRRAESVLPPEAATAARWNVAVMELGALVCTARAPRCQECPLTERCRWRLAGYPQPTGPARARQPWAGTDRQLRGALMAVLRDADAPVRRGVLDRVGDDAEQRERCLRSLVGDGLLEQRDGDLLALPGDGSNRPAPVRSVT